MATGYNATSLNISDNDEISDRTSETNQDKEETVNQLEKNKLAQRLFRKRRKEYLKGLEEKVESYEKAKSEILDLTKRNNELLWMMERANSIHSIERTHWQKERYEMSQIIHNLEIQLENRGHKRPMPIELIRTPYPPIYSSPSSSLPGMASYPNMFPY